MPTGWLGSSGEAAECGSRTIFDVPDLGSMGEEAGCVREEPTWSVAPAVTLEGAAYKYQPLAPSFNSKSPWYFLLDNTVIWGDVSSVLHLFNVPLVEDNIRRNVPCGTACICPNPSVGTGTHILFR